MGRSSPTYRDTLRALEEEWSDYQRALRRRDQPHFDRLFEHAHTHADAGGYQNHDRPMITVLMSIALAQERELASLREQVAALQMPADEGGSTECPEQVSDAAVPGDATSKR